MAPLLMRFQILKIKPKVRYSLAAITIRARACIKGHMIQKVSPTDTSVLIAFNKLAKLTQIRNKIVGIRARKRQQLQEVKTIEKKDTDIF